MAIRDLTEKEAALVRKYRRRASEAYQRLQRAQEALNDLSELICEDGEIIDPENMAIVEKPKPEPEAEED